MLSARRPRRSAEDKRDVAQICLSGHVINNYFDWLPEFNQTFCDRCGEKTITQCPQCDGDIQGGLRGYGYTERDPKPPKHCQHCGSAFPWTEDQKEAALALLALEENLSDDDKKELTESLDALTKDTPWTEVAIAKWKRLRPRISDALWKMAVDVSTEAVKKALIP